jgi:hypothetical protein
VGSEEASGVNVMNDSDESYSYGSNVSDSDDEPGYMLESHPEASRKQNYTVISPVKLAEIQVTVGHSWTFLVESPAAKGSRNRNKCKLLNLQENEKK